MTTTLPPRDWTNPMPSVTCSVWPHAWVCHAVRAHGAKRTVLTRIRDGSSPLAMTSKYTSPVNISAGPLVELPPGIFCMTVLISLVRNDFQCRRPRLRAGDRSDGSGIATVFALVGGVDLTVGFTDGVDEVHVNCRRASTELALIC